MKGILRLRWAIASIWIIGTVLLFLFAPNLQDLVAEKGQITAPEGYTSTEAEELLKKMSDGNEETTSAVLVFHDDGGISDANKTEIKNTIDRLEENRDSLGISDVLAFDEAEEIEEVTVAEDGQTILIPFDVSLENQSIEEVRDNIYDLTADNETAHYLTGDKFIEEDIIINSEKGLEKTLYITVALILVILLIVFRSFVAPLVPLVTVGISYLVAQSIVAFLADTMNFPLSTFTQIFMVAVMFGIGTDYCILLISRFKEEIAQHESTKDAVIATYKASVKTVFFAGLAVLIGFSTIGLSKFSLYQSAVAVAVGVAVIMIALVTLVPFLLALLGRKLFWPFDKNIAHKESKLWGNIGFFAWTRPLIALLIVAIITVPALLLYQQKTSYDSLQEIGDDYGSVIAFNWIADSFGPGQTMPTTVVMQTDAHITSTKDYQDIETISRELAGLKGVKEVRSATRPAGKIIDDFLVDEQTNLLADGLDDGTDGLKEMKDGLSEAADELNDAAPELDDAASGVDELMGGTDEAKSGVNEIQSALKEIASGIEDGSKGATEIKNNLQTLKDKLDDTINGSEQILAGYEAMENGLEAFSQTSDAQGDINQMIQVLEGTKANTEKARDIAIEKNPELANDKAFLTAHATASEQLNGVISGVKTMAEQMEQLQDAQQMLQKEVVTPFKKLNQNFRDTINGQKQLSEGLGGLISGIDELASGLDQATSGQHQVVDELPGLKDGLDEMNKGQSALKDAFTDMNDQLGELSNGLDQSADGLLEINDGLTDMHDFLKDIANDTNEPIAIIPDEAIDNEDFIDGTKNYISDDQSITKWDIVLENNPYSQEAIDLVAQINQRVDEAKVDTIFAKSDAKIGGVSSSNNDLQTISNKDYTHTATFMLIGIFIILIILLKSIIMPIYLLGSLVVTYFTSMAFAEIIFVYLLGHDGLTWANPFFSFVMLIALGIDYSIFLMARFNQNTNQPIFNGLSSAMKNMGTVIISATIILGGTFGAMLPSGVLSLLQIATVVLIGLFLYAFVMLPLFTPIMVRLFGKHNWWPFKRKVE